jgi:hypothetical protein
MPPMETSAFEPPLWLRNGHAMTLAATLWPRRFPDLPPATAELVAVADDTQLRLECHWQPEAARRPTAVFVHGLEGSSASHYMLGLAEKAWRAGFNALRMNVRNCGGTEHLTPTLYHSGLSKDLAAVARELLERRRLPELHLAGVSMGGNMVLKLGGEWGAAAPVGVASLAAVSPALDLARCADALHQPQNVIYEWNFLYGLKKRLRRKARLFPDRYDPSALARARSVREFDDLYTGPHCGFGSADGYYSQCSALRVVAGIRLPTLVIAAEDDPFIPIESFRQAVLTENPNITLVVTRYGGHVGFLAGRRPPGEDRYWAENRVLDFFRRRSTCLRGSGT